MVASVGRCYTNPIDYAQENYYSSGESFTNAEWLGKAANIQELNGQIKEQDFLNAYSSLDPQGNPLRKQQQYQKSSHRYNRPGTDVTLSAPKSVSVAALVYGNQDIIKAHQAAVNSTMKYVENNCIFYQTKQQGKKLLLQSKTAQIAVFHHDDNRNKDPQLHSHCVILNQTVCPDGKWRAVANTQLYKQQKTIGAYYDHQLARQLQLKGYKVEWTSDHTLEIAGTDKEKLDAVFSTRSNQIEAELAQLGLTRSSATAQQKQAVCLKTRKEKKQHHHPQDRIEQLVRWQTKATESRIEISKPTEHYRQEFERIYNSFTSQQSVKNLIDNAVSTLTERSAAFLPHELLRECLRQSQGKYDPESIQTQINSLCEVKVFEVEKLLSRGAEVQGCRGAEEKLLSSSSPSPHLLISRASESTSLRSSSTLVPTRDRRLTTTEALNREQKIIQLAKQGKNSQTLLSTDSRAKAVSQSRSLNTGQTSALKQMVTSCDSVILIQGNAGVGKTYTMKAFAETVGNEQPIRGLAPSAAAADVLQNESGIPSQTLASYLLTPTEQLTPQEVILVDEASMISTRSARQLLEKAHELESRIILIGDTKQLSAIDAGAPFKLLQEAGLPTAVIDQNLRQRDPELKQIVNSLATHDKNPDSVNEAYQKLNQSGKIQQIETDETRIKAISSDYLSRPPEVRQKTLILASTNADKQAIASSVRQGLINEGTLGNESIKIQTLKRKNIDKFALTQAHNYQRGDVIKFQRDSALFSKDLYYRVTSVDSQNQTATLIDTVGITETLDLNKYKQRELYQLQELEIRTGERMRFTKNIRTKDYKQLNGQRFTVEGITPDGQITINSNGKTQNIDIERLLHSDYSYVDTVHSSQGQTADYCIYSAANAKSMTIGRESFYVAASRARQEFVIYTASTQDLGVTVQISRANENAKDLVTPIHQYNTKSQSSVAYIEKDKKVPSETEKKVVDDAQLEQTPSIVKPHQKEQTSDSLSASTEQTSSTIKPKDEPSNISLASTKQEPSHSSNEPDQRSVTNQPKSSPKRIGFDRIIDSLTDSSRQSEELAANLRGTDPEAATTGADESNSYRETEQPGNNTTEDNRAAAELTRELQNLEQRAIRSNLQDRETRKPSGKSHSRNPGQFIKKIKQLTRDIFTNSSNIETGEIWSTQLAGGSNNNQTPRTTKKHLDNSIDNQSRDMDNHSRLSSQSENTSRNKRQSQQQRNTFETNRKQTKQVKPVKPEHSATSSLSDLLLKELPKLAFNEEVMGINAYNASISRLAPDNYNNNRVRLNKDERKQIILTAISALDKYGSNIDKKTTFNNDYYRIEKYSVFETYGYRSYLTIDAHDGRERILTLKGENFHPDNLNPVKNRLTKRDELTFNKIQSALDHLQQIRQLKENAEMILWIYGEKDHSKVSDHRTFEGENYCIERDEKTLRITAKDGRGEIFKCPSNMSMRHPETKAVSNLSLEDIQWFRTINQQIEQKRREAKIRTQQKEKQQKRQQDRGLSL